MNFLNASSLSLLAVPLRVNLINGFEGSNIWYKLCGGHFGCFFYYCPPTKLRECNDFSRIYHSVQRWSARWPLPMNSSCRDPPAFPLQGAPAPSPGTLPVQGPSSPPDMLNLDLTVQGPHAHPPPPQQASRRLVLECFLVHNTNT